VTARTWSAALALDLAFGEPPERVHPVVHLGRAIGFIEGAARDRSWDPRIGGGLIALVPAALASVMGALAPFAPMRVWLLKTTFALRSLVGAAADVERSLAAGSIGDARRAVGRMVSRSVEDLDERLIVSATIESLAENLNDSYVAPLVWYAIGGLPAAAAYRAINTADAMVGYRTARYAKLGAFAARLDDLASFVPARITALAIVAAAPLVGGSPRAAMRAAWCDAPSTASPNGGWPMSAAAGALGVTLEKRGHHVLGVGRAPRPADIARARTLVLAAAALATGVVLVAGRRA
jgi:adenosylcobinamide-phosphate synthase